MRKVWTDNTSGSQVFKDLVLIVVPLIAKIVLKSPNFLSVCKGAVGLSPAFEEEKIEVNLQL